MTRPDAIHGTRAQWAQDRALMGLVWAARRLPYARRVPAFGAVARGLLARVTSYRHRMLTNLDHVWPAVPESRREEIATGAADNLGRCLIEHFSLPEVKARLAARPPSGEGVAPLRDAADNGRAVVLVSGHFGNYEAGWLAVQRLGLRLSGLYRPLSNPYLNRSHTGAMERAAGLALHPQGRRGVADLLGHLGGGGAAAFLCDLYAGNGVEMPFLGRPAMTGLTAAEFALRTGALLVPFYGIRRENGLDFDIVVEAPIRPSDPEAMMAAFNRSLERRIAEHPEQWFWMHRRWKRKWSGGSGMSENLHPAAYPRRKSR